MFDWKTKEDIIAEAYETESSRRSLRGVLLAAKKYEEEYGKDLSEFDKAEMQRFFDDNAGRRHSSVVVFTSRIKHYLEGAKRRGANLMCDISSDIDFKGDRIRKFRETVVFSPDHLSDYLDAVFGDTRNESVAVVYKCFYWLAFCDIDEDDALALEDSSVNLASKNIIFKGRDIPLYEQSYDVFELAKTLKTFKVYKSGSAKPIVYQREDGSRLLRCTKRGGVSKAVHEGQRRMTKELSRYIKAAVDNGVVTARIRYYNARMSGVFYRAFLREQMSMDPGFNAIVERRLSDPDYHPSSNLVYNAKKSRLLSEYRDDYALWKSARDLFVKDSHL